MTKLETIARPAASSDDVCVELLSVMREQEDLCQQLLDMSSAERKLVLGGRIGQLEKVTRDKGELIDQIDGLELRRRELSSQMAARLGLSEDASLAALADRMESRWARDLLEMRRGVSDIVARLRDSNDTNVMLMRQSLDLVRHSLQQLRRSTSSGECYTVRGRPPVNLKNNVMVDCHA